VKKALGIAAAAIALTWALPGFADDSETCPRPGAASFLASLTKAAEACRNLADKNEAFAQYDLGIIYDQGLGVTQSNKDAMKYYMAAANQGFVYAQDRLGTIYAKGLLDQPQDYQQSANWYGAAADQGFADAQYSLGVLFEQGRGVPQNYAQAIKYYSAAANQGYPRAQFNLAYMYVNGKGVKQDFVQAYVWLNLAAAVNSEFADSRDQIAKRLTPEQLGKAQDQALQWKPQQSS
jgi:TPR repeat protein